MCISWSEDLNFEIITDFVQFIPYNEWAIFFVENIRPYTALVSFDGMTINPYSERVLQLVLDPKTSIYNIITIINEEKYFYAGSERNLSKRFFFFQ